MNIGLAPSPLRLLGLIPLLLLPVVTRSPAFQSPTSSEESDSYAIYSMLLRTEVGPEWKVTAWTITQETQTFPGFTHNIRTCLSVSKEQESAYSPLIADYLGKNQSKHALERKFDLPAYTLAASGQSLNASVVFEVSGVGFNKDRSRALVYVGHHCGSLCGGGRYHLLVKQNDKWQVDQEYRGMSCLWAS